MEDHIEESSRAWAWCKRMQQPPYKHISKVFTNVKMPRLSLFPSAENRM